MSFPVSLSLSPVHEAFSEIEWNNVGNQFELCASEQSLLRSAEENVMDYTLADQQDATAYVLLLLKILDSYLTGTGSSSSSRNSHKKKKKKVSKLQLEDAARMTRDDAVQYFQDDTRGVVAHYVVSRLTEVIQALKTPASKSSAVTIASTLYPSGILVENWRPLLRIIVGGTSGSSDAFAQRGAAFTLSCILLEGLKMQQESKLFSSISAILESVVSWITSRLQSSVKKQSLSVVTPSLTTLIVSDRVRSLFDTAGGIGYLSRHLKTAGTVTSVVQQQQKSSSSSVQQLYELCYCLWLMSFDCETRDDIRNHFHRDGAVAALVDLVSAAPREKVVRVALSSLRNLAVCERRQSGSFTAAGGRKHSASAAGTSFLTEMIGCGLVKSVDLAKERNWKDPEIIEDLDVLHKLLHDLYNEMTTWDVYKSEIESAHLQWGIVHTEKFFKANAQRMEGPDGNFSIVKTLVRLILGDDEEVAAIACFDLGEFARHYPNGRAIAKRLGAREVVMALIDHDSSAVRRQALLCVSKMLVQNWQAVG